MASPLIHADGHVLAALDASPAAAGVADLAAWAATRLEAPLDLLHAIERTASLPMDADLSGSLSLGSQDALLVQLAALDEQRSRVAQQHGRALLQDAQAHIAQATGITAQMLHRHGTLVDNLLELEAGVRLFVLGKRGQHAQGAGDHLGSTLERVLRTVHRPVLIAMPVFRPIERFVLTFDGSATTRRCVALVCASPLLRGAQCTLVTAGAAQDFDQAVVDHAMNDLTTAGFTTSHDIVPGHAEDVIAHAVGAESADLLVMGAYGHSRIRRMIVGSTTTAVLRTCEVPVLLLR